jgi:hypothetical protein
LVIYKETVEVEYLGLILTVGAGNWFNCTTAVQYGRSATLWHFSVLWPSSSNTAVIKLAYCCLYIKHISPKIETAILIDSQVPPDAGTVSGIGRSAVSAEVQVRSQASPPDVWWTECHCDRRSHPSVTVLLLHSHIHLIFALTRRTNGRLGTSKSNVVPETGGTWLEQFFCLVCTGFKINSTRGGVCCSELSFDETCLLLRAFYCSDLFRLFFHVYGSVHHHS